jgi:RNA polymerase sigma factor (sigma-70 family)
MQREMGDNERRPRPLDGQRQLDGPVDDSDATDRLEDPRRLDPERAAARARDTDLVLRIRAGDGQAFGALYDAWFDRVFDLVSRIVRDAEVAAEVTQDAFLSAWRKLDSLDNPDAFGGWLLRIARNAAYNRSAKEQRSRPVDDQELTVIESVGAGANNAPSGFGVEDRLGRAATPGAAIEDREVVNLVWQAAEALPARDLEVLDLQLRHGLTPAEIGEMLDLNRNAANQLVHRVRGRLEVAIRARVLWRSGEPVCEVLATRLEQAKITAFNAEAVRVIERHVPGCNECDERQRLRLQPTALFAALPLLVAPMFIKTQACAALTAAGVPMGGSAFAGSSLGAATAAAAPHAGGGTAGSAGSASGGSVGSAGATPWGTGPGVGGAAAASFADVLAPTPPPITPIVSPPPALPVEEGRRRSRAPLSIAASILVLLLLFGAGLWWGGRDDVGNDLIASGAVPAPTNTTVGPSTTAAILPPATADPTTTVEPTTTETPTVPTTARPTTTPLPTTTAAPTTTTTRPTYDISFTLTPSKMGQGSWGVVGVSSIPVPTLTWKVAPTDQGKVTIVGPDDNRTDVVLSTAPSGSIAVCPGARLKGTCNRVPDGTYTYTLTVTGPDGATWETRTQTLTVVTPNVP